MSLYKEKLIKAYSVDELVKKVSNTSRSPEKESGLHLV